MQELSALGWTTKLRNVNCSTRLLIETPEESFYCALSGGVHNSEHRRRRERETEGRRRALTELDFDAQAGGEVDQPGKSPAGQRGEFASEGNLLQVGGSVYRCEGV
jgi:hypothetical protein